MTKQDEFDSIEQLIKSSDKQCVVLGMVFIKQDELFAKVRTTYGNETNGLPEKFKTFAQVCDFVEKKCDDHEFMCENWPRNADVIYRPASLLVLSKMRLIYDQTAKDEKIVSTR